MAVLDPKGLLDGVLPVQRKRFAELARAFEKETGFDLKIRSGRRTCAEQNDLYASGRTRGGDVVTYVRGCSSWHVLGLAVDADPVDPATGSMVGGCSVYTQAGEIWESLDGVWGGRFPGFGACGDAGHFEWHPGVKRSELCPDPDACDEAVLAAAERFPAPGWSAAKILGSTLFAGGLLVAGYVWYKK